jgi:dienelactone hydrolase
MSLNKFFCLPLVCVLLLGLMPLASHAQRPGPPREADGAARPAQLPFEKIDLDSLETEGYFSPKPVKIKGYLLKASQGAKAPGAVLAPACNGLVSENGEQVRPQYRNMAKLLNDMGITVLLIDGFNPRGFNEICTHSTKRTSIDSTTRLKDSLGGLAYLRSRSDVLADQVVLVTWGAAGSMEAMDRNLPEYAKTGIGFAGALMFYPHCGVGAVGYRFAPYAPIQMFVGDKDTWNPAAPCQALKSQQESGSASFDIKLYPDSYHAFDQPRPPSLRKDAAVGPVITGGNPVSAADAYKTSEAFLSRLLTLGTKAP